MSFYNKTFKFAATLLLSSSIFGGAAFAADSTKPAAAPAASAKSEAKPAAAVTDKTVPVEKMDRIGRAHV